MRSKTLLAAATVALAALVPYAAVSGQPPIALPFFPEVPVDADTQGKLKVIASETARIFAPWKWSTGDPLT